MTCKLRGRLRKPEKLRGKVTGVRVAGPSGVYIDGDFQGEAQGWYNANLPGLVPVGLWDGAGNRTDANGYYDNNERAPIPDGCYRNGGLVDPYYERIRDAAQAEGGGLYLFQLEHGQYAGEQVIWQEMGEVTPWTSGLGLPQGKTYDLMGSGEYLGQSVSIRRPVDGVWDGVNSFMDASSMVVGGRLHQAKPSAWFIAMDISMESNSRQLMNTSRASVASNAGVEVRNSGDGLAVYISSGGALRLSFSPMGMGLSSPGQKSVGVVRGAVEYTAYANGTAVASSPASTYADNTAQNLLRVGGRAVDGAVPIKAKISYLAIYTREPTPYEISLHKRTP